MPQTQADGEVVYRIRADTSQYKKDLKDSEQEAKKSAQKTAEAISDGMERAEEAAESAAKEISEAMEQTAEAAEETAEAVDTLGDAAKDAEEPLEDIGDKTEDYKEKLKDTKEETEKTTEKTEKFGSSLKNVAAISAKTAAAVGAAAVGMGTAIGGIGVLAVKTADDIDEAMNSFAASTGTAEAALGQYRDVLEEIYKNNYGEDFQDIADGMALVKKNLGNLDNTSLQNVTEAAFLLRDTFEYDIVESTRAAKAMVDNFGISGYEAMGLIAAGAQNGLDYSGELIDSISEYSVQFAKLGFTADDMFRIMEKGAESGAWNLDKVGDAIKEFSIRAIDGSDSTIAGFEAIGLNADTMAMKFALGGESAKEAFAETVAAIESLDNPIQKDAAGVALFGTMWEDLGPDVVAALADIESGAYNTSDALGQISEVKYDDLGSAFEALKRSAELTIAPLGEKLIPTIEKLIEETFPMLEEVLPPMVDSFTSLLPPILDLAENALPPMVEGIQSLVSEDLMPYLTDVLFPKLQEVGEALEPLLGALCKEVLPALGEAFAELIPLLLDIVIDLMPVLVELVKGLAPIIQNLVPIIVFLAEALGISLHTAISALTPIIREVMEVLDQLTTNWSLVVDFINNVLAGNWDAAWQNIIDIFKGAFNLLPGIVEAILNGVIGQLNGLLDGINKIGGDFGIDIKYRIPEVELPRFHTGGIIDFETDEAPILAQDGEMVLTKAQQQRLFAIADGENLAVSNELDRMLRAFTSTQSHGAPQSDAPADSSPYIFYLFVDGESMAEATLPYIDKKQGEMIVLKGRG